MKTFRATILAIIILALATSEDHTEKIRTAIPQANLNYFSVYVADAKGFFREEGLDIPPKDCCNSSSSKR